MKRTSSSEEHSFACGSVEAAAQHSAGQEIGRLRWAKVAPGTFEEMRQRVWETDLPQHGDAILVWVNEGDLYMHSMPGRYLLQLGGEPQGD